ncbi:PMCA-type calcium-translocating P-type ATPase [Phycomyces nitens]|nr:PMCA-type calcium-translocating P-type ATPase [Phycomyces nitens]
MSSKNNPSPTIQDSSPTSVTIDLREHPTPHNDPTNPFAFTPSQLSDLMDPKNLPLLTRFGGLLGIARGLHVNLDTGLVSNADIHSSITIEQVLAEPEDTPSPSKATEPQGAVEASHPFPQRLHVFGSNVLPEVKTKSIFHLMWIAFQDKTLILLSIAAVVSLSVGLYEDIAVPEYDSLGNRVAGVKWVEGVAIIIAILLVVLIGSANDYQKEKQFQKLNAKKEDRAVKATRGGALLLVSVREIQVGDILHLEPGDIAATDGIFIQGHNLRCDESAATGESDAVRKQDWQVCYTIWKDSQDDQQVGEKTPNRIPKYPKSMPDPFIISGSKVLEGSCTYLVTAIGQNSYYGRTMMALRSEPETTPLQEKLNGLADMIAKLGSAAGILMLIVLLIRYFVGWKEGIPPQATTIVMDIMKILIVVVTIVVVAVPEGLPLAVTLALAYATQRMLKDNNLVRVLAACETMGNATTVCSDKTGTLTQNKMTVVAGTLGVSFRFVEQLTEQRADITEIAALPQKLPFPVLSILHQSIALNSSAFETPDDKGEPQFVGNKTETALLAFARATGSKPYDTLRKSWPVEQLFPFSSERKAMAIVIRIPHPTDPHRCIYRAHIKGASELFLEQCSHIVSLKAENYDPSNPNQEEIKTRPLTEEDRKRVEHSIQTYALRSLRTIGVGYRDFESWPPQMQDPNGEVNFEDLVHGNNITLLGIVGIQDPLRPGVTEAVKACQQAGVFVRMVTGDNLVTAKSIAKECGIYTQGGIVMEGPVFRALPQSEMDAILPRLQVLARSSPEDKRILVSRLRELGDIVAVTGDGTNDGPALKMADVGFSMGIAGTEVAKEASSIILMDDNFSSIVKAIMWGRCVNDAVKKFLEFQITVNLTAVILTFISAVVSSNQKSVLTAVQLLWVNLIMDTFAALALATDPPTEELLLRAPESRSSPLITFKMWKMIIGQAIFQIIVTLVLLYGNVLEHDTEDVILQTIVFNTFVFCQIFNELNCRRIDSKLNVFTNIWANKFFIGIFIVCVVGQCLIVQFGGQAFQVIPLNGPQWAIALVIGVLSLPIGVVIRLIPDDLFAFVFRNPVTRQRYMGNTMKHASLPPSVYMADNERVAWNNAANQNIQGIDPMKQQPVPHPISKAIQPLPNNFGSTNTGTANETIPS